MAFALEQRASFAYFPGCDAFDETKCTGSAIDLTRRITEQLRPNPFRQCGPVRGVAMAAEECLR
jgi:hypothetical protein